MIQILSQQDLSLIDDDEVVACLKEQFTRLDGFVDYPNEGYFIYLESVDELLQPIPINRNGIGVIAPPLKRFVEMVEIHHGIYEIVLILHADFGVSLFLKGDLIGPNKLNELLACEG